MYKLFKNMCPFRLNFCKNNCIRIALNPVKKVVSSKQYSQRNFQKENEFAFDLIHAKDFTQSLKTEETLTQEEYIFISQKKWANAKLTTDIFNDFHKLAVYCRQNNIDISDQSIEGFIASVNKNVQNATDEELKEILSSLITYPKHDFKSSKSKYLWLTLDAECEKRLLKWNIQDIIDYLVIIHQLKLGFYSSFFKKSIQMLASQASKLTPSEVKTTMFFVGVHRKSPYNINKLENQVHKYLKQFSVDDLAVIAMGFFKSKTKISNEEILHYITEAVIKNSKTIHEISLAALLKIIRFSVRRSYQDVTVYRLLNQLQTEVPRLSIMCHVQLALLGNTMLKLHEGCLTAIAENIEQSLKTARLKDIERLILTYGTFNYIPKTKENIGELLLKELRKPQRENEIQAFKNIYACCVSFFTVLNIYPLDLIKNILKPEYLTSAYGSNSFYYGREILTLHNSLKIFYPEEVCDSIPDNNLRILAKKYTEDIPSENTKSNYSVFDKMYIDIMNNLKSEWNAQYVCGKHLLSHHPKPDIILCKNHQGDFVKVDSAFDDSSFGLVQRPPDDNNWIVLVILGRNSLINESFQPTGPFVTKLRELKALGYNAAFVPWNVYTNFRTNKDKIKYLKNIINESLDVH